MTPRHRPFAGRTNPTLLSVMIRSALAALALCAVPLLHAQTPKTAAPDKAPKTEKTTTAAADAKKAAADAKKTATDAKKTADAAKEKAETKAEKPAKPAKPTKPATSDVDAADKALLDHADKELKKLTPAQTASLLKLANEGSPEELQTIPGVGEIKAVAIKKARPLASADKLIMVDGIGEVTFDGIVKWVKDGMPKDAAAPKPEAKTKPKAETKPAAKTETKPATKADTKPAAKTEAKPATKAETKPAAKK